MDERNTDRSTIVTSHDSGPSFLSQLIGLVLVVVLVVGVWALVTDTLPGGAPGTTVGQTDTTVHRDDTNLNIEMKDDRPAPVAPATETKIDVDAGTAPAPAAGTAIERTETKVDQTSTTNPSGT